MGAARTPNCVPPNCGTPPYNQEDHAMSHPLSAPLPDDAVAPSSANQEARDEASLQHARLVMGYGKRYAALTRQGAVWVTPAAGCLLQPAIGDLALVSLMNGQGYILTVLERAAPDSPAEVALPGDLQLSLRSEERRVGKECVSPCRSRWSPYH